MSAPTARVTADVTVHDCTVTVVRRGGWSWGPDPQALVRQVLDALPELLAERFADHLAGDGPDVEITEPVTMVVRPGQWPAGDAEVDVLGEPAAGPEVSEVDAVSFEESLAAESSWSPWSALSVAGLFAELAERGDLDPLLALVPDDVVRVYLRAMIDAGADPRVFESDAVTRLLPADADPPSSPPDVDSPVLPSRRSTVDRLELPVGEVRVCSALPFLLAGPLARTGYLDAIGPALAGVELAEDAPLFTAALAYKVLGATERGWRRAGQDREAAAAFAGLSAVPDDELAGFARRVRPALPLLDGVLALSLCRGHNAGMPLLITGFDDGLLLVDAQGMFPIALADGPAGLLPHWQACGRPPVLVCDSLLPPGCLAALAAAGMRFQTDVRPLRGDPLTRVPWRTPLWTVEGVAPDLRLAAELPGHTARLAELVRSLVVERRAVPLAEEGGLERSVTLAASLGLGMIAWTLWRDRETPDPTLALRRFADLEATVRLERDAVRVRVPLGRRHADLLRAGLLSDVPHVVWLGGRTLTFSGG